MHKNVKPIPEMMDRLYKLLDQAEVKLKDKFKLKIDDEWVGSIRAEDVLESFGKCIGPVLPYFIPSIFLFK